MRPLIGRGLSAAVYTQTTDVEIEVNGLMTYDREQVKMDEERIAAAARKLYGPPPLVRTLVETSEKSPQTWRYTTTAPTDGWQQADFDDSEWKSGPGGFGTEGTPGRGGANGMERARIWLRRTFELSCPPEDAEISAQHSPRRRCRSVPQRQAGEEAEAWLCGDYRWWCSMRRRAARCQPAGTSSPCIAIKRGGGQYIDVGLVELVER